MKKYDKLGRVVGVVLLAYIVIEPSTMVGQKSGGGQGGGAQQASQQNANGQNTSSASQGAGITGGAPPIESILFSYEALAEESELIAAGIKRRAGGSPTFVITTSSDVSAFLQWRAVLSQGETLLDRLRDAQEGLNGIGAVAPIAALCVPPPAVVPPAPGAKVGSPFIASVADIQTAVQTIASITAVNEALVSSTGNMTDPPLINLVAGRLQESSAVYVPSMLPPSILSASGFGDGPLANLIWDLEYERSAANAIANDAAGRLADWQIASTNRGGTCTNAQAAIASSQIARWTSPSQTLATVLAAVDTFESSLFSGQAPSPVSTSSSAANNANSPAPVPGAMPAPPISGTGPQNQSQSNPAPQSAAGGTAFQQIFAVDLLYHQIPLQVAGSASKGKLYFLELHSLESGGGVLTKSNLFLGSRNYFSGGAVSTFTLLNDSGTVECAGIAYGYQGYVKPKKFADTLRSNIQVALKSNCQREAK